MNQLIRKAVGVLFGMASVVALFLMYRVQTRIMFVAAVVVWAACAVGIAIALRRVSREPIRHLPLIIATIFAASGLFSIIEEHIFRVLLAAGAGCSLALLLGWSVEAAPFIHTTHKPYRRMRMMLWVFDAYAIVVTLFALTVFFPHIPFWILHLSGAIVFAGASHMIWRMYASAPLPQAAIWMAVVGLLLSELIWVFSVLPFGYLVSGFLVTWIWYLMQILIRFHFTTRGIEWKRQGVFLGVNVILFITLLVWIVRWV